MTKAIICTLFIIIYSKVRKNIESHEEIVVHTIKEFPNECTNQTGKASEVKYDKK
jgi:hypothetical protein